MNNIKVKICGIRSLEAAQVAVDEGVNFLGFNFVKSSKRFIEPEIAIKIISEIKGKTKIVGIFQNSKIEDVNKIAKMLDLNFVQLHGEEDEKYMSEVRYPIVKKINHDSEIVNYTKTNLQFFLIDRKKQGKGEMVDLEMAKNIAEKYKVFFSGGLTPENVLDVVKKVKPFAVDVAGGIETDGKEDTIKIRDFIRKVKSV